MQRAQHIVAAKGVGQAGLEQGMDETGAAGATGVAGAAAREEEAADDGVDDAATVAEGVEETAEEEDAVEGAAKAGAAAVAGSDPKAVADETPSGFISLTSVNRLTVFFSCPFGAHSNDSSNMASGLTKLRLSGLLSEAYKHL